MNNLFMVQKIFIVLVGKHFRFHKFYFHNDVSGRGGGGGGGENRHNVRKCQCQDHISATLFPTVYTVYCHSQCVISFDVQYNSAV